MGMFAHDTFTDANTTALSAHTADSGGSWTNHPVLGPSAQGSIQNNRAHGGATNSYWYLDDVPQNGNCSVFVDLVYTGLSGINFVGVFGRMDLSGNGYALFRDSTAITVTRFDAGTPTNLVAVSRTYEDCNIELRMFGTTIEAYVIETASGEYVKSDGSTQVARIACISTTDATYDGDGEYIGIQLHNGGPTTRVHLDNFMGTEQEVYNESVTSTMSLAGAAAVKAFRRPLYFKDGKRIARLPAGEFVNGTESVFLNVSLIDLDDATYYYYGGLDESGDWQINRYLKSDLTKSVATIVTNGGHSTLSSAWAARGSLVYA